MGACSSSPTESDATLSAPTNSSPAHAAVTQVKEKRSDSDDANNSALDTQALAESNQAALHAASGSQPAADSAAAVKSTEAASKAEGGVSSRREKEREETKEQTVEIRPTSASQQKLSARSVAPLPIQTASTSPALLTLVDTTATASSTPTDPAAASSSTSTSSAPADFPTSLPASSQFSAGELKYKSTVRDVLVLLLDRFTRTMEYEKAAFQELAVGVGYNNYMQLYDYAAFESFLRLNFVIPPSPTPQQQDTDLRYISQYFSLFLTLAQSGECDSQQRTMPTREQLTTELQRLCSVTAEQLRKWCVNQHATVEVKEHLMFFSSALQFAEGDLVNQPELLYKNIDDICT